MSLVGRDSVDAAWLPHEKENSCVVRVSVGDAAAEDHLYAYANALRRTLIGETPYVSFAPDPTTRRGTAGGGETKFKKNTSNFNDEFLRTRLALIPLNLPKGVVRAAARGGYQWVGGRRPEFVLGAGHGEKETAVREVDGGDVVVQEGFSALGLTRDTTGGGGVGHDRVSGGYPLLVKLLPGQEVHATMSAEVGMGRQNACFSPIGTVAYRIGGAGRTIHLVVEANNDREPTAEQHVYDAVYWARKHLERFRQKIRDPAAIRVETLPAMSPPGVAISVPDETETRASVVTTELRHLFMDGGEKTVAFAAHRVPHPLESVVEFRLQPARAAAAAAEPEGQDLLDWGLRQLDAATTQAMGRYAAVLRRLGGVPTIA